MTARYPDKTRNLVDQGLRYYFPETRYPEVIYEAMRYSLFSGGKRFRGILVVESGKMLGHDERKLLPTACAVEYIHTYSLIHDDLPSIDNDDLRRGIPTCHKAFGEDIAILAGDALYAEAFHLVSSEQEADDPAKVVEVIRELAASSGAAGMVGGQVVDIKSEGTSIDAKTLEFIHENKTGELIKASVRAGAIIAGAADDELEILTDYARYLGLAFQIADDILDVTGDTAVLGKTAGSDEKHGKATYPSLYGLSEAKRMAEDVSCRAKDTVRPFGSRADTLIELADFVYERQS